MKRKLKGGLTSVSLPVFIADTSSTTGGGLSGVTSASSGLVMEYRRQGQSTWTNVTPQAGKTTLGSYLSGGILADGSLAGAYEVDFPDAAFASGARMVLCRIRGVTNMLSVLIEIELDAVDYQDAAAFGLSKFADIETDTQNIQSRIPEALVDGRIVAQAQSVTDKNGYALTQAFPANFNLLGIGATGEILVVQEVAELGVSALTANGAGEAIPSYVWNALTTTTYTDQSFGDRILISTNNNRSVAVTVTHHAAAVLHDAEPNSIPEDAFQNGAVSARVIAADAIDGDALAASALTEIANAVAAPTAAVIADAVWDEILVGHLGAGTTGEALNNSGGSGNPWITDIATGYTGTQAGNVLNQVKAKADLITSGSVQTSIPVTAQGQINGPLYIGDDYLTANGRQFDWTIPLPAGFVAATSTCKFGMIFEDESGVSQFNLSGTVADVGSGNVRLRFELPRATTGALKAGFHRWSTEIVSATGVEVTAVAYSDRKLVEWREKQT